MSILMYQEAIRKFFLALTDNISSVGLILADVNNFFLICLVSDLEENSRNVRKKIDAMTLIKEGKKTSNSLVKHAL